MLAARGDHASQRGSLALVSFTPQLTTRIFAPRKLEQALPSLKALIGRLAGVLPDQRSFDATVDTAVPAPTTPDNSRYADLEGAIA